MHVFEQPKGGLTNRALSHVVRTLDRAGAPGFVLRSRHFLQRKKSEQWLSALELIGGEAVTCRVCHRHAQLSHTHLQLVPASKTSNRTSRRSYKRKSHPNLHKHITRSGDLVGFLSIGFRRGEQERRLEVCASAKKCK